MVMPGAPSEQGISPQRMVGSFTVKTMRYEDSRALLKKNNAPHIKDVSAFVISSCRASYGSESRSTQCFGVEPNIQEMYNWQIDQGRFFTEDELKGMARLAVIGLTVKEDIFGEEDVIGEMLKINRINFRVIGVMEERGVKGMEDQDDVILLPLFVVQKQMAGIEYINGMIVQADEEQHIEETVEDIKKTLRERHGIKDAAKDDFVVQAYDEIAETMASVMGIFSVFLTMVAAIALVVGGIGIMNIMLVSVSERTREVGLRKAVGAREKDILLQFLIEALVLTFLGGLIGIVLGVGLSYIAGSVLGRMLNLIWTFSLDPGPIILAFGVSAFIGLAFGIYPSRKAAKLDPIEALRYE